MRGELVRDERMTGVDLFLSMPVYLHGLASALGLRGLVVAGAKLSTAEGLSPGAEVVVADLGALPDGDPARLVAAVGAAAPVVLVVDDVGADALRRHLAAGVHAVVGLRSSVDAVVDAVLLAVPSGRSADAPDPNRLSRREQQVLRQIASGRTHGQIARVLGISQHTVDTYVKRIKSKLAVGTKAELTRAALLGG